ncbi:MAG TPA: response regulator [Chitinophagaceae bacterium]|jgi:DNA-binding NtrC family response regulator|nr:response regulator [Chitinophagaceae bacterium]
MQQSKPRILIIDDDKDFCLMLSLVFDDREFEVVSAFTLEEARQLLCLECPSIVLLDNKLPDGRGLDFIETIFDIDPRICILMISGEFNYADRELALRRGVTQFIGKPCSFKTIAEAVRSVLV